MQNEVPFNVWHEALKSKIAAYGLPELPESLARISHGEGMTVEEALQEYLVYFE